MPKGRLGTEGLATRFVKDEYGKTIHHRERMVVYSPAEWELMELKREIEWALAAEELEAAQKRLGG